MLVIIDQIEKVVAKIENYNKLWDKMNLESHIFLVEPSDLTRGFSLKSETRKK